VKTAVIVRAAVTIGWLAGIALILAGWPLPAGLAAPATALGAALAGLRWGGGLRTRATTAATSLAGRLHRTRKTGATIERA